MRIIYIANSRLPTEKAYGINIVKTCQALANKGAQITLIAPNVRNTAGYDIFSYYSIPKNFEVRYVPIIDAVNNNWKFGFLVNQISLSFLVFFLYLLKKRKSTIFLVRDELSGLLLRLRGYVVFYDMHGFPEQKRWFWKIVMKRMTGIVVTNRWKKEQCYKIFGISREKIIIAPNGFDPALFDIKEDKIILRKKLGLPKDRQLVVYTGHLYDWKGAAILAQVAPLLPDAYFVFVGGISWDIDKFRKQFGVHKNILIIGHKPYVFIPRYLKAADVLVLPNSQFSKSPRLAVYSRLDSSPIKMFEYMASGTPIVASGLPSIKEVLNKENAMLVESDNPHELKIGIETVLHSRHLADKISKQALEDSKDYTWETRADTIFNFISKHACSI